MKFLKNLGLFLLTIVVLVAWVMMPWQGAIALALLLAAWMFLFRSGAQARSVTAVGVSTLGQRIGSSAVIVVGIAGVVGVLVALLAMAEGYAQTLRNSGSNDTAIVMRGASAAEVTSSLSREDVVQIEQAPGIARNDKGEPIVSAETVVAANLPVRGSTTDEEGSAQVRGVSPAAFTVRPHMKIVEGRTFQPGLRELVVGKGAVRQFEGLKVGATIKLGAQPWTVVGVFVSGDSMESELWADANVVNDSYQRGSGRNSATVRLTNQAAFKEFKAGVEGNPQLKVTASTTLEFFAKQSEQMTKILRIIGITVGSIMAVGAVFGALNTMFAAVATRAREIATLRAIGFRGLPVVVAVMLETTLLALIGGLIGGFVAWLLFNGFEASTMSAVGKLSFNLAVSPGLLWEGIKWALAIGFVGGLFPAVRAASLPVTTALREA
ncbi:ABC transporter permease [Roseateles asaccharophilus]|uniref:ABC transport system permease protein n=1 Tax=Roseateles asaccharophilus TaxID=582607 RepID=A0ABU2ACL8_9BURK|nr:ABC transporter permease [Roseateles asaccharophilus]MDR7334952.1 putative ABC transport system permease protein [Roseateles asaccharophilus]